MKTKIISKLKKELMIIELPTLETQISIGLHCIGIKPPPIGKEASDSNGFYHVYKEMFHDFKILGKPDEIKEEDMVELFDELECENQWCENGKIPQSYGAFSVCDVCDDIYLKSFHSALESEIYWENPLGKEEPEIIDGLGSGTIDLAYENKQWNIAQEKTFDRNRSIILFKN